ncbi:MAG: ParA family protein [Verrucomicrobiales bacterium]|nr:ParA family protein [Verrucomicrobiales bacterium]
MAKAKVVSLLNMKGGVGKTTCAVNLATYLARDHGKRVLLVDFDSQTNASLSLMPETAWEKWADKHGTMADVLEARGKKRQGEPAALADCIIHNVLPEVPGLDLIPSHLALTFIDLDLAARPGRERIVSRKLAKVIGNYDVILCDCPPNLMTATQNALYASDAYLIPMQPDYLSTLGLNLLQDRLTYLKRELEFKITCLGVVFTRVRGWLRYHAETMERLRTAKDFKRIHFFETVIPENIKLAEAPMEAKPIELHDSTASGAEAYRALTKEFVARLG